MNTSPHVPFHKSEKMFRRYETHIHKFLLNYPEEVWFDPAPLSVNTFACRFRDSVASLLEYQWTSPIDTNKLREVWEMCAVTIRAGLVGVVPRSRLKALSDVGKNVEGPLREEDKFAFTLDKPDQNEVIAAALLLANHRITLPVKITNCPRNLLDLVADKLDVGISENPAGYFVML